MPGDTANAIPDRAVNVQTDELYPYDEFFQIRQRFEVMQTFWSAIFSEGLEDDRFIAGEQWPEHIKQEREEQRRPCNTYNMMPSFVRQITNKARQDDTQIKCVPVETNRGKSPLLPNTQATKDYSIAEVYSGVIRNIEQQSRADQVYDTALKHACDHGFGFFYLINDWSPNDPFVQDLFIRRIKNSYSVMLDPDAQESDFRDMQDAFMFTNMNREVFREKYPNAAMTEFAQSGTGIAYDGWYNTETIRVAQYFKLDHREDEALKLSNGNIVYRSEVEPVLDEIERDLGIYIAKKNGREMRKAIRRPVCTWRKMTADENLEGPLDLPFSSIPIFPVFGEEVLVDGRTAYESAIRHAKDAQRSYNYWRTAATETVALAPRNPWVISQRQLTGHESLWERANQDNLPYLPYNHIEGVQAPQRNYPTQIPAAELSNATQDAQDMQQIIGLHDASLGKEGNEKSGKAILARQHQGMTSTFQFPDNLRRAQQQCGRCMVEAIPRLFDEERIVRVRLPDDTEDFVEINRAVEDEESGATVLVHDIAYGKYDVIMETGPSYSTLRQEAADLQMQLLKVLGPEQAQNIVHLIVGNMGIPGAQEVAAILRKMLPNELKSQDEIEQDLPKGVTLDEQGNPVWQESGEPYQPQPSIQQQLVAKEQELKEAEINADKAQAEADIAKAEADKIQAQAKIEEAKLKTAELQAEVDTLRGSLAEQEKRGEQMGADIQKIIEARLKESQAQTEEQIEDAAVDILSRVKKYVDQQVAQLP